LIYGPTSGFKTIQVRLYQICHFPDMYTIHKRMVYLDGKWQFYPAVLFVESSPVKQRDGIVAAAGIRMGNMGKGYLVLHPVRNRTASTAYFAICRVVVSQRRTHSASLLRLAG